MQASKKIPVAGVTGGVGRHLVDVLKAKGHDVVPMSRSLGVDVVTGHGLAEALEGVECIIDVATQPSPEQEAATAFFTASSRNLQEFGERAGVRRMSSSPQVPSRRTRANLHREVAITCLCNFDWR
jgi:nucleoside-diphosphate-sugar epimerase